MNALSPFLVHGYAVLRGLFGQEEIQAVRQVFDAEVLPHEGPLLRLDGQCVPHEKNEYGHITNGLFKIHNPAIMAAVPKFCRAAQTLLLAPALRQAIAAHSGETPSFLAQTMALGYSRGPLMHQDSLYMDSIPPGHVLMALVALEKIGKEEGQIFVIPRQETPPPIDIDPFKGNYLGVMKNKMGEYRPLFHCIELNPGDALILRTDLIQGSLAPHDPARRLLALIAHYVTDGHGLSSPPGSLHDETLAEWEDGMLINLD